MRFFLDELKSLQNTEDEMKNQKKDIIALFIQTCIYVLLLVLYAIV